MRPKPCHILLVDDDDITNFLSKEMFRLSYPDILIDTTLNGKEALDFLQLQLGSNQLPDIILLDINMPIMDGWDFLDVFEEISAQQAAFENIQVFVFTSSVYQEDMNRAMTYPSVKRVYSKPLDDLQVKEIVSASVKP